MATICESQAREALLFFYSIKNARSDSEKIKVLVDEFGDFDVFCEDEVGSQIKIREMKLRLFEDKYIQRYVIRSKSLISENNPTKPPVVCARVQQVISIKDYNFVHDWCRSVIEEANERYERYLKETANKC